jgi:hypothetical protein
MSSDNTRRNVLFAMAVQSQRKELWTAFNQKLSSDQSVRLQEALFLQGSVQMAREYSLALYKEQFLNELPDVIRADIADAEAQLSQLESAAAGHAAHFDADFQQEFAAYVAMMMEDVAAGRRTEAQMEENKAIAYSRFLEDRTLVLAQGRERRRRCAEEKLSRSHAELANLPATLAAVRAELDGPIGPHSSMRAQDFARFRGRLERSWDAPSPDIMAILQQPSTPEDL